MELQKSRVEADIQPSEVSKIIYGTHTQVNEINKIKALIHNEPTFNKSGFDNLSRVEKFTRSSKIAKKLFDIYKQNSIEFTKFFLTAKKEIDEELPFDLHFAMFIPTLQNLTSPEQKAKWLPAAHTFKILGTYVQTELSHGSDLSKLKTTATYDPQSDSFILHTPDPTAYKWWPGNLGKSSNVGVVMAQLIIHEKKYGVYPFFVQFRDFKTHQPMPGITLFDIGPKQGYDANDNGGLIMTNVKVPRENLFARFIKVEKGGKTTITEGSEKVAYSTMMITRINITELAAESLSRALTIVIRYSHIRRQFKSSDAVEEQVINYKVQQWRIFPYLMNVFINFGNAHILKWKFDDLTQRFENNDFSTLKEVHIMACITKCVFSWFAMEGIENCRRACGGHGYLKTAGFADLYERHLPMMTYEGENYVLIQQATRFLAQFKETILKNLDYKKNIHTRFTISSDWTGDVMKHVPPFMNFMSKSVCNFIDFANQSNWTGLPVHIALWESLCKNALFYYTQGYEIKGNETRWLHTTMIFSYTIILQNYQKWVDILDKKFGLSAELKDCLVNQIGVGFSCWLLTDKAKTAITGLQTVINYAYQQTFYENILDEILEKMKKNCVVLTDGFMHSDFTLNSSLGRYDGKVYEALLENAQKSDLNQLGDVTAPFTEFLSKL